jgi:hypothetical protein
MSEHDPGDLYEPPPPRKRRRRSYLRENELDDAWAAAAEDDAFDDAVEIEDLAAGYVWDDRDRLGVERDSADDDSGDLPSGLGPLPPSARRAHPHRRSVSPARSALPQRDREPAPPPGGLPFWGILMLVILAIAALIAVGLACVFALSVA